MRHTATETSGGKEAQRTHEMSERTPRRQLVGQRGHLHPDCRLPSYADSATASCPEKF
jgi:hypothetical protein